MYTKVQKVAIIFHTWLQNVVEIKTRCDRSNNPAWSTFQSSPPTQCPWCLQSHRAWLKSHWLENLLSNATNKGFARGNWPSFLLFLGNSPVPKARFPVLQPGRSLQSWHSPRHALSTSLRRRSLESPGKLVSEQARCTCLSPSLFQHWRWKQSAGSRWELELWIVPQRARSRPPCWREPLSPWRGEGKPSWWGLGNDSSLELAAPLLQEGSPLSCPSVCSFRIKQNQNIDRNSHLWPVMAPPRASTRKLTRKPALLEGKLPCVGLIIGSGYSGILKDRYEIKRFLFHCFGFNTWMVEVMVGQVSVFYSKESIHPGPSLHLLIEKKDESRDLSSGWNYCADVWMPALIWGQMNAAESTDRCWQI